MAGRKLGELDEWRHRVGVLDHEMAKADLPALHLYAVGGLAEIWHGIAGTRTEDLDVEVRNVTHIGSATQTLIARLGRQWGADPDWLNEQVATSRVLPVKPDPAPEAWYTGRKLRVDVASAPRLLAMKLRAGRPHDWPTILTLAERLKRFGGCGRIADDPHIVRGSGQAGIRGGGPQACRGGSDPQIRRGPALAGAGVPHDVRIHQP